MWRLIGMKNLKSVCKGILQYAPKPNIDANRLEKPKSKPAFITTAFGGTETALHEIEIP